MDASLFLGKGFGRNISFEGQGPMPRPREASVHECVCMPVNEACFQCARLVFSLCVHSETWHRGYRGSKDPQAGNKVELLVLKASSPASAFYKSHNLSELHFTTCVMGEHDTYCGFCQS